MRLKFFVFFLSVTLTAVCLHANGQSGSLGDPVYTFDFGSGPNPGPALGTQYTNMQYTSGCPNDGQYSIISSSGFSSNCHTTWQSLSDHTGNANGYYMLVNADLNPSVFFTAPVDVSYLCPNTTYRFTAYIANLITQASGPGFIEPNITFTVATADGTPIATPTPTGNIPANDPSVSPWTQYGVTFTTPANLTSIVVTLTNNADGGTGNDLALDDISVRAYGPAITPGFNNTNSTTAPLICAGDVANFTVNTTVQQGVFQDPRYQWQKSTDGITWADVSGETNQTMAVHYQPAVTGTYYYRMGAANGDNINSEKCRVYSQPLTVNVYSKPTVTGLSAVTPAVCVGDVLTLTAGGGADYVWTLPDNTTTQTNPLIIPNAQAVNSGKYTVVAYNQNGCPSPPVATQVTIVAKPVARATVSGDNPICQGTTTALQASGGVSYSWSPGATLSDSTLFNPVASPLINTTYRVLVTNSNGCTDTTSVNVNVLTKPTANAGPDKAIFEGQSVKLSATTTPQPGDTYSWTPAEDLSDPTLLDPVASPTDDITYTLKVTSADCGSATDDVFVKVFKKIVIPNTFSPNGDGINDYWAIDALVTYPQCIMTVFNRYGQQVYHSIGYSKPWDGKYNGELLPTGTYYFTLDLKNTAPEISGWVVIVH